MTALIVIGAILLLLFILLASSIRVDAEYDKVFKYRVKYLFFTFVKNPLSPREIKRKKKKELRAKKKKEKEQRKKGAHLMQRSGKKPQKSEVNEVSEVKTTEQAQAAGQPQKQEQGKADKKAPAKPKMKFSFDLIKRIIGRASPHVKRIFKKIRLSNVVIDIVTGGDEAAKTAISYGVHCSAVYGLVGFLDNVITFKAEKISVRADFDQPKNEYYAKGTLKLRLSTLLHSAIWGFFAVLSEIRKGSVTTEQASTEQKKAA